MRPEAIVASRLSPKIRLIPLNELIDRLERAEPRDDVIAMLKKAREIRAAQGK
ncbi:MULTISPECIES: hypothetical protein [Sphingomonas]|uniref:hypothetical protein n=1 Tax=Sphingomonas TaxID=13687 RepID=UPI0013B40870|nr:MULTISPECIES: hypothetical protein [Sphingomonas]